MIILLTLLKVGGYALPFVSLGALMLITIPVNMVLLPSAGFEEDSTQTKGSMMKLLKIPPVFVISLVIIIASNTWYDLFSTDKCIFIPFQLI